MELCGCTESVREACITQLVETWLRTYNNDRLALLVLLDIENSVDVCQTLLQVLFKKSTPLALTEDLTFLNEECVSMFCPRFLDFHFDKVYLEVLLKRVLTQSERASFL